MFSYLKRPKASPLYHLSQDQRSSLNFCSLKWPNQLKVQFLYKNCKFIQTKNPVTVWPEISLILYVYMQCLSTNFPKNADAVEFQIVASCIIRIYYTFQFRKKSQKCLLCYIEAIFFFQRKIISLGTGLNSDVERERTVLGNKHYIHK